jgi:hypothetical protein
VKIKTLYTYCQQVGRRGKDYETNGCHLLYSKGKLFPMHAIKGYAEGLYAHFHLSLSVTKAAVLGKIIRYPPGKRKNAVSMGIPPINVHCSCTCGCQEKVIVITYVAMQVNSQTLEQ